MYNWYLCWSGVSWKERKYDHLDFKNRLPKLLLLQRGNFQRQKKITQPISIIQYFGVEARLHSMDVSQSLSISLQFVGFAYELFGKAPFPRRRNGPQNAYLHLHFFGLFGRETRPKHLRTVDVRRKPISIGHRHSHA